MAAALKFALHYPKQWHDIGHDRAMRDATKRLKAAGLIEAWTVTYICGFTGASFALRF
jgi:hypothetical protein